MDPIRDRARFGGHVFRISAACYYFSHGATEEQVAAAGRWASVEAMRKYLRGTPAMRNASVPLKMARTTLASTVTVREAAVDPVRSNSIFFEGAAKEEFVPRLFWTRMAPNMEGKLHMRNLLKPTVLACRAVKVDFCRPCEATSAELDMEWVCPRCLEARPDWMDTLT